MVVEGDHGRLRRAGARFGHQPLEEVGVAEVHPVEHADDDEQRPERRLQGLDPLDDVHRRLSRLGRREPGQRPPPPSPSGLAT